MEKEDQCGHDVLRRNFVSTVAPCFSTLNSSLANTTRSVTVVSCLRLRSLVNFASSSNPTWDQTEAINWSNIEINVGIICACMPTIRVILVRIFPRIMGTTKNTTRSWGAYGDRSTYTKGGSAIASRATKDMDAGRFDSHAITYVKTFEVQRTASDEVELMQAEDFRKKSMPPKSSTSSVSSF
jgi:hypothetical protein